MIYKVDEEEVSEVEFERQLQEALYDDADNEKEYMEHVNELFGVIYIYDLSIDAGDVLKEYDPTAYDNYYFDFINDKVTNAMSSLDCGNEVTANRTDFSIEDEPTCDDCGSDLMIDGQCPYCTEDEDEDE